MGQFMNSAGKLIFIPGAYLTVKREKQKRSCRSRVPTKEVCRTARPHHRAQTRILSGYILSCIRLPSFRSLPRRLRIAPRRLRIAPRRLRIAPRRLAYCSPPFADCSPPSAGFSKGISKSGNSSGSADFMRLLPPPSGCRRALGGYALHPQAGSGQYARKHVVVPARIHDIFISQPHNYRKQDYLHDGADPYLVPYNKRVDKYGNYYYHKQKAGAAARMEAALLFYVLDRELQTVLIAENAFMLGA